MAERLPVYQRTEEWLDARLEGIGASEAATSVGISRWDSPALLWARKLRLAPPRQPTTAMLIGTATEDLNAQLYTEATGIPVRRERRLLRSREHPWMLSSLDRRAPDRVVELKYSDRSEGYGAPGTDEVPDEVLLQVLHQMVVASRRQADVSLLTPRRGHAVYHIEYDEIAATETIEREREFWRGVQERREPHLVGPLEADREYLVARYPRSNGEWLQATPEQSDLLALMRTLSKTTKGLEGELESVKEALRASIGEYDGIEAPGVGRLRWTRWAGQVVPVEVTNWEAVARGAMQMVRDLLDPKRLDPAWGADDLESLVGLHTGTVMEQRKKAGQRLMPEWDEETQDD